MAKLMLVPLAAVVAAAAVLLQIIGPLVSDMKDETHAKELAA
jgi:hypothetical protein